MRKSVNQIVGDPEDLRNMDGFEDAYQERCRASNINHVRFLGPNDKFSFDCKRLNTCCKNFTEAERIALDPYDIYRLSRNKKMSTDKFIAKYVDIVLDQDTHVPIALLKYQGEEGRNKCHFMRSYGCSVYADRPLRCRLYPLGKISNSEKSYYMLINNCPCGDQESNQEWTVPGWLESSECHPFLKFQDVLNEFFDDYHADTYKAFPEKMKLDFGKRLYDPDSFAHNPDTGREPTDESELMARLAEWTREFLNRYGCLKIKESKVAVAVKTAFQV